MPELSTVKIKTGPDSYITVNEIDYDSFKFMEYIEPVKAYKQPTYVPTEALSEAPVETVRKKRTTQEDIA